MKVNFFKVVFGSILLMFGIAACGEKCQRCTYAGYSETFCEEEFDSKDEYKDAIKTVEALGATCKRD